MLVFFVNTIMICGLNLHDCETEPQCMRVVSAAHIYVGVQNLGWSVSNQPSSFQGDSVDVSRQSCIKEKEIPMPWYLNFSTMHL